MKFLSKTFRNKPLFYGLLLLFCTFILIIIPSSSISRGSLFDDLFGQIILLLLAIPLIFYGIKPNTLLEKIGEKIFKFYSWINSQKKRK